MEWEIWQYAFNVIRGLPNTLIIQIKTSLFNLFLKKKESLEHYFFGLKELWANWNIGSYLSMCSFPSLLKIDLEEIKMNRWRELNGMQLCGSHSWTRFYIVRGLWRFGFGANRVSLVFIRAGWCTSDFIWLKRGKRGMWFCFMLWLWWWMDCVFVRKEFCLLGGDVVILTSGNMFMNFVLLHNIYKYA